MEPNYYGRIHLTPKEIGRADSGRTVVVRPQENGYMVAVVRVDAGKGEMMGKPYTRYVKTQGEVQDAVKDVVRTLSKMGEPGNMGDASRHRHAYNYDRRR